MIGLALSEIVGVEPGRQPEVFCRMVSKLAPLRVKQSKRMDEGNASPVDKVKRASWQKWKFCENR
jgi:hypothetical protein